MLIENKILSVVRKIPVRAFTTGGNIDLKIDTEGVAVMSLQRRPVNSYNLELISDINKTVAHLEKNEKYKGLIITSAIPKIFSAGLDLSELNKPDAERLRSLWRAMQDMVLTLYGSSVTTTVAINGHAAAGACVLSMLCDYRVMVNDRSKIGLNDTAVGIVPSWWVREIMIRAMGYRRAEIALTASTMYTAEEAFKTQMIDELATDEDDAIEKCRQFIRRYDTIPKDILSATKKHLRDEVIKYVETNRDEDVEIFARNIMNSYAQQQIGKYVEQLKHKKK